MTEKSTASCSYSPNRLTQKMSFRFNEILFFIRYIMRNKNKKP